MNMLKDKNEQFAINTSNSAPDITCQTPAKKYKLYKSSINKSLHFV